MQPLRLTIDDWSSQRAQNVIVSTYHTSSEVQHINAMFSRFGGPPQLDVNDMSYWMRSVGGQAGAGALMLILTFMVWIVWSFIVCCCNKPNKHGYTAFRVNGMLLSVGVLLVLACTFDLLGLVSNQQLHSDVIDSSTGITTRIPQLFEDARFVIQSVQDSAQNLTIQIDDIVPHVNQSLNQFPDMSQTLPDLVTDLTLVQTSLASKDPLFIQIDAASNVSIPCPVCRTTADQLAAISTALQTDAVPVLNTIQDAKQAALDDLIAIVPDIHQSVDDALEPLRTMLNQTRDLDDQVRPYVNNIKTYEEMRWGGLLGWYLAFLIAAGVWALWVFWKRKEAGVKTSIHLFFVFACMSWLLFAIFTPLTFLTTDGCIYLDTIASDIKGKTSLDDNVADAAMACLANQNILSALNVTDKLNFCNKVVFPSVPSADGLLNFNDVVSLQTNVSSLDATMFPGYNQTATDAALQQLNAITDVAPYGDYFDRSNVSNVNPNQYGSNATQVQALYLQAATDVAIERTITQLLIEMQTNTTRLVVEMQAAVNQTQHLLSNTTQLTVLLDPLFVSVDALMDLARCGPLSTTASSMYRTACHSLPVRLNNLMIASGAMASALLVILVFNMLLSKRLQHISASEQSRLEKKEPGITNALLSPSSSSSSSSSSNPSIVYAPTSPESVDHHLQQRTRYNFASTNAPVIVRPVFSRSIGRMRPTRLLSAVAENSEDEV
jgi:hypothetical protein